MGAQVCARAYLARAARWVWERRTVRGSPTASQRPGARNSRGRASLIGTSRCVDQQSAPAARGVPTGWTSHGLQGGMSGRPAARRSPIMAGTTCASERTRFEDLSGKHSHTLRLLPVHRQLDGPLTRHLVWVRLCPAAPFAAPAPGTTRARQWRRLRPLWRASNSAHSAHASKTGVCMLLCALRGYQAHRYRSHGAQSLRAHSPRSRRRARGAGGGVAAL